MSIRKRYDEASQVYQAGLYEAALILALVAVAAASERQRRTLNPGLPKTSDRNTFCEYLNGCGLPRLMANGEPVSIATTLYEHLRCKLVHEAQVQPENFAADEPFYLEVSAGKLRFGRHLVLSLLEIVKTDKLGRDEFRDLLTEYDNVVEARDNKAEIWDALQNTGVSNGRLQMLERVIVGLRPERISSMTCEELKDEFWKTTVQKKVFRVDLVALKIAKIVDDNNRLTDLGCAVLQRLSEAYSTIDPGRLEL